MQCSQSLLASQKIIARMIHRSASPEPRGGKYRIGVKPFVNRLSSSFVLHGFAALLEHLALPNKAGERVGGQLEILRQLETVSRTCLLTERAEHATRSIENEFVQHFLAARLARHHHLNVHGNNVDAIFRTGQRAKVTRDAERIVRLRIHVQTRRAMKARRYIGTNLWILFGVDALPGYRIPVGQGAYAELQRQAEAF